MQFKGTPTKEKNKFQIQNVLPKSKQQKSPNTRDTLNMNIVFPKKQETPTCNFVSPINIKKKITLTCNDVSPININKNNNNLPFISPNASDANTKRRLTSNVVSPISIKKNNNNLAFISPNASLPNTKRRITSNVVSPISIKKNKNLPFISPNARLPNTKRRLTSNVVSPTTVKMNNNNLSFISPKKKRRLTSNFASPVTINNNNNNLPFVSAKKKGRLKSKFVSPIVSTRAVSTVSDNTNLPYFIIPSNENGTHEFILYKNNKFIINGVPHIWDNGENTITSRYWRCCKYKSKCSATLLTHQYHNVHYDKSQKFGQLTKVTPHTQNHGDTWTVKSAEKKICMHMIKNSGLNNKNSLSNYKQFQRLYPNQSMAHFKKYKQLKSYLSRHVIDQSTPASKQQYIQQLNNTDLGYNFWKYQANSKEFSDLTWEEVKDAFIKKHPHINIQLHPDVKIHPNTIKLIEIEYKKALLEKEQNYYYSKVISSELPQRFISNMFLGSTEDGDVILQSEHGGYRINHENVKLVNVDCTFTCPFGLEGTMYKQLCFINAQLDAPDSAHTHNQYPSALILLTSKKKESYQKAFKLYKELNQQKYGYTFQNIQQISSDMEWNLFTELKSVIFIKAQFLFCLFHYMQANFKKMRQLGLYSLLKTDREFYKTSMLYLYATFIHPKWVSQYQQSMSINLLADTPIGHKLKVKAYLKYNRQTYHKLFPVEWWNCSQRDSLKFTNNFSETFNKHWKSSVGARPNILNVTKIWRNIDANATVDFETHIKDTTDSANYNTKPKKKQQRDEAITKTMKDYNEYCYKNMKDNNDHTQLEDHATHVKRMFKLMKNYQQEITEVLTNSMKDEEEQTMENDDEKKSDDDVKMDIEQLSITYHFRKYPLTKLFQETNILNDNQCFLLNQEIKTSQFWLNHINNLEFTDNNKNILKNTTNFKVYSDRFDITLLRVCIAFKVNRKWHPGIIIDVESNYLQIFLPNDKNFDRLLQINKKKHVGKIKII